MNTPKPRKIWVCASAVRVDWCDLGTERRAADGHLCDFDVVERPARERHGTRHTAGVVRGVSTVPNGAVDVPFGSSSRLTGICATPGVAPANVSRIAALTVPVAGRLPVATTLTLSVAVPVPVDGVT